jgi:hypothetical protein
MKTPYVFKGKLGSNLNIQHLAAESGVVMLPLRIRVCLAGFFRDEPSSWQILLRLAGREGKTRPS